MNFPSQIFFNDINHGYRADILKKIIYGCFRFIWLWLLISVMKRCAEWCALQLYHTSLNGYSNIFVIFVGRLRLSKFYKINIQSRAIFEYLKRTLYGLPQHPHDEILTSVYSILICQIWDALRDLEPLMQFEQPRKHNQCCDI